MKVKLNRVEEIVYGLTLKGLSVEEMAKIRNVAKSTIASELCSIYQKKVVNSRLELLAQRIQELENELYSYKFKKVD